MLSSAVIFLVNFMATGTNTVGRVLGATTAVGGAIVALPATGENKLATILVIVSGSIGALVLLSFVSTRVLRKFI